MAHELTTEIESERYYARQLAERLNALTEDELTSTPWWEEIVEDYDYDRKATEAADPSGMSETVIFPLGTRVDCSGSEWVVQP